MPTIITEETRVRIKEYKDLSYKDYGTQYLSLFIKGKYIGEIEVWTDMENENREYICLNYNMMYLDTIKKRGEIIW